MSDATTRLLELHGKHAIGRNRFAVVDADCFDELNRYRWKAKPNVGGGRTYATRNKLKDGRLITLRLNRVVLGIEHGSPGDVRFKNGDSLDCRRGNLEHCSRGETTSAAQVVRQHARCITCGSRFAFWTPGYARKGFCSSACRRAQAAKWQQEAKARRPRAVLITKPCDHCGKPFAQVKPSHRFCCDTCRYRAKNERKKRAGPFQHPAIEGSKAAIFA